MTLTEHNASTAPLTVDDMDDTALIKHYRDLGYHPDAIAFLNEKEAAASLGMCQKKLATVRRNDTFELGEVRKIGKEWRYQLRALVRYHENQFAPESW